MSEKILEFPPFRLDLTNARLQKGRQEIPLQPKEFTLLGYLASHAGRLLTSEELLNAVWPGVRVTPGVLKVRVRRLRQALGDDPDAPHFIETVQRRGYRFIAEVVSSQ